MSLRPDTALSGEVVVASVGRRLTHSLACAPPFPRSGKMELFRETKRHLSKEKKLAEIKSRMVLMPQRIAEWRKVRHAFPLSLFSTHVVGLTGLSRSLSFDHQEKKEAKIKNSPALPY